MYSITYSSVHRVFSQRYFRTSKESYHVNPSQDPEIPEFKQMREVMNFVYEHVTYQGNTIPNSNIHHLNKAVTLSKSIHAFNLWNLVASPFGILKMKISLLSPNEPETVHFLFFINTLKNKKKPTNHVSLSKSDLTSAKCGT